MRARPLLAALTWTVAALVAGACGQASLSTTAPDAPKCQVTVDSSIPAISADGGTGTVTVTTTRDCTWSATSGATWIALTGTRSGQGSGTVTFRVDANGQPAVRRGNIDVNGSGVTVSQDPAPCKFAVSPSNAAVSAAGGTITIAIQTLTGCAWTAAVDDAWAHVVSAANGNGAGTIRLAIDANPGGARTTHAHVADQTITIDQAEQAAPTPTPCHYSLTANVQTVSAGGGSNTVQVTADNGCAWTAASNAPWITITSGSAGVGSGVVAYSAAANAGDARTGTLTIAGQTLTVTQAAAPSPPPPAPCSYSISSTSQAFDSTGGGGTVAVTTAGGCAWTATSNAPWITITQGASGSGNGSVSFSVASNAGGARNGTLTIAGQTFTVSQAAAPPPPPPPPPCTYSISPTSQPVVVGGASGTVTVTTGATCAWSATSNNADWISITSGASGTGNGSVGYTVAPNGTGQPRSGTATIAGQTFTVNQAGS